MADTTRSKKGATGPILIVGLASPTSSRYYAKSRAIRKYSRKNIYEI